jgi:hypothetical protein
MNTKNVEIVVAPQAPDLTALKRKPDTLTLLMRLMFVKHLPFLLPRSHNEPVAGS